jgi:hypothetical protein
MLRESRAHERVWLEPLFEPEPLQRGLFLYPVARAAAWNDMSSRRMIDLMIQRSAVELFASLGVAIAPTPPTVGSPRIQPDDLVGLVHLSVNGVRGTLALCASPMTLSKTKGHPGVATGMHDWLRELANQLAGRIKNRLARYQVSVEVSLPTALGRNALDRGHEFKTPTTIYVFRTVRDDVQVVLSGDIGSIDLRFSGSAGIAEEGELILF